MLSKSLKILLFIVMLAGIAYVGVCVKANFVDKNPNEITMPSVEKAKYSLTIENTGQTLFATDYEQHGKVYVLHGYWELIGRDFRYRKRDIILDEAVLGKIIVNRRPTGKGK